MHRLTSARLSARYADHYRVNTIAANCQRAISQRSVVTHEAYRTRTATHSGRTAAHATSYGFPCDISFQVDEAAPFKASIRTKMPSLEMPGGVSRVPITLQLVGITIRQIKYLRREVTHRPDTKGQHHRTGVPCKQTTSQPLS